MISPTQRLLPYDTQHSEQTSTPPEGFEPATPARVRLQTHALARAATHSTFTTKINEKFVKQRRLVYWSYPAGISVLSRVYSWLLSRDNEPIPYFDRATTVSLKSLRSHRTPTNHLTNADAQSDKVTNNLVDKVGKKSVRITKQRIIFRDLAVFWYWS